MDTNSQSGNSYGTQKQEHFTQGTHLQLISQMMLQQQRCSWGQELCKVPRTAPEAAPHPACNFWRIRRGAWMRGVIQILGSSIHKCQIWKVELTESGMVWVARDAKALQSHLGWTPSTSPGCSMEFWALGLNLCTGGTIPNILPELLPTPQPHPVPQDSALRWNNFLVFQLPGGFPVTRSSCETETEDYFVPNQLTFGKV